jgi:hypothetical protein
MGVGLGKGLVGLVAKPVAGVFDAVGGVVDGVRSDVVGGMHMMAGGVSRVAGLARGDFAKDFICLQTCPDCGENLSSATDLLEHYQIEHMDVSTPAYSDNTYFAKVPQGKCGGHEMEIQTAAGLIWVQIPPQCRQGDLFSFTIEENFTTNQIKSQIEKAEEAEDNEFSVAQANCSPEMVAAAPHHTELQLPGAPLLGAPRFMSPIPSPTNEPDEPAAAPAARHPVMRRLSARALAAAEAAADRRERRVSPLQRLGRALRFGPPAEAAVEGVAGAQLGLGQAREILVERGDQLRNLAESAQEMETAADGFLAEARRLNR